MRNGACDAQSELDLWTKIAACEGWSGAFSNNLSYFTHMNDREDHLFSCSEVADMAWMIQSSPLLGPAAWRGVTAVDEKWCADQFAQALPWLVELDAHPDPLIKAMSAESSLLGKRFESLVSYWLNHSGRFELAGERIVFAQSGRTFGEVDFVFREKGTDEWIHLEVACKYYLASSPSTTWSAWRGANSADRLDLKVLKMEDQLRLLQSAAGREWAKIGGVHASRKLAMLKGYFFVPFNQLGRHVLPKDSSPHHHAGWWMNLRDANTLTDSPGPWIILPKNRWFAPWNAHFFQTAMLTGRELIKQLSEEFLRHKSAMIVQADPLGGGYEISRGMIVPDRWPGV